MLRKLLIGCEVYFFVVIFGYIYFLILRGSMSKVGVLDVGEFVGT